MSTTKSQWRYAAFVVALGIGVTAGGVAAGALVLAPAVAEASQPSVSASVSSAVASSTEGLRALVTRTTSLTSTAVSARWKTLPDPVRRLALPGLFGAIALTGFVSLLVELVRRRFGKKSATNTTASASWRQTGRTSGKAASRTPKAVQALADSGTDPVEIAWRTGLSLDAVAMLLSLGASPRQLRPPTA